MVNMVKSGLEGEKEARTVLVENLKRKEGLEMHSQLPYYDEYQWYDMGIETVLSQIAQQIHANFRMPSWGTSKRNFPMAKITKKLFRVIKIIAANGKKGRFQTSKNVW